MLSRVRIAVARMDVLRSLLRRAIDRGFFGSLAAAADLADVPQPTLWRVVEGGQDVIEAPTLSALRRLLPNIREERWQAVLFSKDTRQQIRRYERAMGAEIRAHATGYGLAATDASVPMLSDAAEGLIEKFWRWGIQKGHHPERLRLATWRVRAPFFLGKFSGGIEPDITSLRGGPGREHRDVELVKLGIRREKILLREVPAPLNARLAARQGLSALRAV